jgi:hypothetical protein
MQDKSTMSHRIGRPVTPAVDRFWAKVNKTESCWLWTAGKDAYGYGVFSTKRSTPIQAHRYSFYLHHGFLPKYDITRSCGNRACVRPDHLLRRFPKYTDPVEYYI